MAAKPARKTTVDAVSKPFDDRRLGIPRQFAEATGWISGNDPVGGYLVMLLPGRYRLISETEFGQTERLGALWERIALAAERTNRSALDFEDNASTTLGARLIYAEISPGSEWRLSLPSAVTEVLGIDSKGDRAVVVLAGRYIEIWNRKTYLLSFEETVDEISATRI